MSQKDLICKTLKMFKMLDCKTHCLPIEPNLQLTVDKTVTNDNIPYRQLIGSLMYVMLGSRPDICFAVIYMSQFQNCYDIEHFNYLKKVLCYLKYTMDYGLKI